MIISDFYQLLGQVGATVVSIIATLFIGYLLYLKERRDGIGVEIISSKKKIQFIIEQLRDTPIPGVNQSLLSVPQTDEEWNDLSITRWSAGTSWDMRVNAGEIRQQDVWTGVTQSLEDLVRGVLPNGLYPEVSVDSQTYRTWATIFIKNTNHIEWIYHETDGDSLFRTFIKKMIVWEMTHSNPVLTSNNIILLVGKIMNLRKRIIDELFFEQKYLRLKIENAINHFNIIIVGFLLMSVFSIVAPLLALFYNNFNINLAGINLIGFIVFTVLTIGLLIKSVKS
jgi:hypothetical protein